MKRRTGGRFHLAGIIPIASQPLNFGMPWHDCMQPLDKRYLLVERAVLECATAGCETIWIICPITISPLLRSILGDYIEDPVMHNRYFDLDPRLKKKFIPIYYVPVHPRDQKYRGSLSWSLLYGAEQAYKVCRAMSFWVTPTRFYAASPYGIYPVDKIREVRKLISSDKQFTITTSGFDFRHGYLTGFTFTYEDFKYFKKKFFKKELRLWDPESDLIDGKYRSKKLPVEKRYTGRFLKIEEIFDDLDVKDSNFLEIDWYYWGDTWEGLREYYASMKVLHKPFELFRRNKHNRLTDEEGDEDD